MHLHCHVFQGVSALRIGPLLTEDHETGPDKETKVEQYVASFVKSYSISSDKNIDIFS